MKLFILACALAVALVCVQSRPLQRHWTSLIPATKAIGEIWTDCSQSTDGAKILSISFSPDPPQKNNPLTINATVETFETVTDGGVMVNLTYNGFEIFGDSFDLCFLLSQIGVECPVQPGKYTSGGTVTVPGDLPSGKYVGFGVATDPNGKELGCIEVNLSF
eukprot:Em0018g44a